MVDNTKKIFFVWKKYQRRPEVLAPLVNAELKFIPHLFKSKYLRIFDYLFKLVVNISQIVRQKPDFVIVQCPPTYSALPAALTGTPYIIDAHNPLFQVEMWQKLPGAKYLIQNAKAIIVHNLEMYELVEKKYTSIRLFNISDPIKFIAADDRRQRDSKQILVIASFDPWDEPVELLLEVMEDLTEYNFIVTADINKLSTNIREKLQQLKNVRLTGFLPVEKYHDMLCSSLAALVLTTSEATQPSGACEALSSNTQLVISKTSLTEKLFGEWATLVDNSSESIKKAIRDLTPKKIDLTVYRDRWNLAVEREILELVEYIDEFKHQN
ncbi:hypothetical protein [Myxosarcina sp. GI1]|uniref:hypothetical protein n=1 Tax=Myxosarcina sp. GI1 TaxID=1541065 RepID=UPI00055D71B0|nr:hypothetical protein [Myxosarcina sp. GI1]